MGLKKKFKNVIIIYREKRRDVLAWQCVSPEGGNGIISQLTKLNFLDKTFKKVIVKKVSKWYNELSKQTNGGKQWLILMSLM